MRNADRLRAVSFFVFPPFLTGALLAAAFLAGCSSGPPSIGAELYAEGFSKPLFAASPPGGGDRLFVVEKGGKVRVIAAGVLLPAPFLDLSALVSSGSEQGLLGLAFHPDYERNGFFYVDYTDLNGDTVVARYERSAADENAADPSSSSVVLRIDQPYANHNGGMLAFGPDGYLYAASGDGGGANDPDGNAQSRSTLLGKLLRIDVDSASPYAVPPDNPFDGIPGERAEIWAYGLRNPWRFSFDRDTGDLYIGDVGQGAREEIDRQPASSGGGENYGWPIAEGSACLGGSGSCGLDPAFSAPIHDYGRTAGRSVTGGYVYRGSAIDGFRGRYVFGDFGSGRVWSFRFEAGAADDLREHTGELDPGDGRRIDLISSFGEDSSGELYILDYQDGEIFKILPPR